MTKPTNEEILNDFIELIWPMLDAGVDRSDIEDCFHNALDCYTPPPADSNAVDKQTPSAIDPA